MGVNGIYGLSGSGLDVESMVKVGMLSKQNEYDKMQQKYTSNEWKKSEYLSVYSEIQTFNNSTLSQYKLSSNMNARSASSNDSKSVSATANATAAIMTHYVNVESLASNVYLIGTAMTRENSESEIKNQLQSILFGSKLTKAGNTVNVGGNTYNADDTAIYFTINDGVHKLASSTNSEVVTATASANVESNKTNVEITAVAQAANEQTFTFAATADLSSVLATLAVSGLLTAEDIKDYFDSIGGSSTPTAQTNSLSNRTFGLLAAPMLGASATTSSANADTVALSFTISDGKNKSNIDLTYGEIAKVINTTPATNQSVAFLKLINDKIGDNVNVKASISDGKLNFENTGTEVGNDSKVIISFDKNKYDTANAALNTYRDETFAEDYATLRDSAVTDAGGKNEDGTAVTAKGAAILAAYDYYNQNRSTAKDSDATKAALDADYTKATSLAVDAQSSDSVMAAAVAEAYSKYKTYKESNNTYNQNNAQTLASSAALTAAYAEAKSAAVTAAGNDAGLAAALSAAYDKYKSDKASSKSDEDALTDASEAAFTEAYKNESTTKINEATNANNTALANAYAAAYTAIKSNPDDETTATTNARDAAYTQYTNEQTGSKKAAYAAYNENNFEDAINAAYDSLTNDISDAAEKAAYTDYKTSNNTTSATKEAYSKLITTGEDATSKAYAAYKSVVDAVTDIDTAGELDSTTAYSAAFDVSSATEKGNLDTNGQSAYDIYAQTINSDGTNSEKALSQASSTVYTNVLQDEINSAVTEARTTDTTLKGDANKNNLTAYNIYASNGTDEAAKNAVYTDVSETSINSALDSYASELTANSPELAAFNAIRGGTTSAYDAVSGTYLENASSGYATDSAESAALAKIMANSADTATAKTAAYEAGSKTAIADSLNTASTTTTVSAELAAYSAYITAINAGQSLEQAAQAAAQAYVGENESVTDAATNFSNTIKSTASNAADTAAEKAVTTAQQAYNDALSSATSTATAAQNVYNETVSKGKQNASETATAAAAAAKEVYDSATATGKTNAENTATATAKAAADAYTSATTTAKSAVDAAAAAYTNAKEYAINAQNAYDTTATNDGNAAKAAYEQAELDATNAVNAAKNSKNTATTTANNAAAKAQTDYGTAKTDATNAASQAASAYSTATDDAAGAVTKAKADYETAKEQHINNLNEGSNSSESTETPASVRRNALNLLTVTPLSTTSSSSSSSGESFDAIAATLLKGILDAVNGKTVTSETNEEDGTITVTFVGTTATGEIRDENNNLLKKIEELPSSSFSSDGNTFTYGGVTYTAKAQGTVTITNNGDQDIKITYGELADGFTLSELVSKINSKNENIRATYDTVQDRFSIYNKESGEAALLNIGIAANTDDGNENVTTAAEVVGTNTANLFNAFKLKQSSNGTLADNSVKFTEGSETKLAGTNGSVKIDGVDYSIDSNKTTVNGVNYTFTNETAKDENVVVNVTQDTAAIAEKVKSFVSDYNALLTKLYKWYDEKPNSDYKPLTATQKEGMKTEQIEKWEEKAKAGLLYHDQTLSKIITEIRSAVTSNVDGIDSKYNNIFSVGISTTGLKGQLVLDETKLNAALAEDPDSVYNIFAKLDGGETQYQVKNLSTGKTFWTTNASLDTTNYKYLTDTETGKKITKSVERSTYNGVAQRLGDIFMTAMKNVRSVSGSTADITEDSELNNLMRELQTKMSNFKKMMQAFETQLYKKYDAMESSLALLGAQLNYVTNSFS